MEVIVIDIAAVVAAVAVVVVMVVMVMVVVVYVVAVSYHHKYGGCHSFKDELIVWKLTGFTVFSVCIFRGFRGRTIDLKITHYSFLQLFTIV